MLSLTRFGLIVLFAVQACLATDIYSADDGHAEFSTTGSHNDAILVGFQVTAGKEQIGGLSFFDFFSGNNGHAITYYLWSDPTNDGLPGDAQVLRSQASTLYSPTFSGLWQDIIFSSPVTLNVGDWFYVGATFYDPSLSYFVSGADTNAPISGNSWMIRWPGQLAPDANNLAAGTAQRQLTSNILIRAFATPEPSTTLLGGAGLALLAVLAKLRGAGPRPGSRPAAVSKAA